ncbi:MAG: hypothetical protein A3F72_02190 [Bacteroidetes bacterium RIFCSPLOWO2_12_FULL_35_15]|nr:MAG: hypothetical protein A3F72_02190 [Bacteroidetes bacterium RIFCSPLOWO2_12_FULL_35_15]
MAATASCFATVITVNNNVNSPGQYTSLQTAIDNANDGDSIYVHGSYTTYGSITVNKPGLTLIGTGYAPQKDIPLISTINAIIFDTIQFVSSGRNFKISGFNIVQGISSSVPGKVHNVKIERCYFGNVVYVEGNNWLITNNLLIAISIQTYNSIIISNNIFRMQGVGVNSVSNSDKGTVIISNNIFMNSNTGYPALNAVSNAIIQNNVFFKSLATINCSNNSFNNNLSYLASDNTLPPASNVGVNNYGAANGTGIDPKFVFLPLSATDFSFTHDYHLRSTAPISPGRNGGSDGTDIGIYGGSYPWVDMTGTPNIPQVKTFNVINPSVNAGTPINISVKAKKQN